MRVSAYRCGKKYEDYEVAKAFNGNDDKVVLKHSPFLCCFEYGAGVDRNYQMQLQFEDCIDFIKVLFPQCDAQTLFNHYSGHDKQKLMV